MITGLIGQCISPNILQIYMRGITCLDDFRSQFSLAYVWPVSVQEFCNFIAHLFLANYSHSTTKSYLSGISFFQKLNGFEDITQSFIIKKLLEGINRSKPNIKDCRLPITRYMWKDILASLPRVCWSIYETNLFQAAFSIAFHGLFRIGELVVNNGDVRHIVYVSDVNFERHHLRIHLSSSKTDQLGAGSVVILDQQPDENLPQR